MTTRRNYKLAGCLTLLVALTATHASYTKPDAKPAKPKFRATVKLRPMK